MSDHETPTPSEQRRRDREIKRERRRLYEAYEGENLRSKAQAEYNRTLPYSEFLRSLYWKEVRRVVFKAWGHRRGCARCGSTTMRLDIHHKTYAHRGDELNHLEDLIVLCGNCHAQDHELPAAPEDI